MSVIRAGFHIYKKCGKILGVYQYIDTDNNTITIKVSNINILHVSSIHRNVRN